MQYKSISDGMLWHIIQQQKEKNYEKEYKKLKISHLKNK
jgi:hypothetical protein